MDSPQTFRQQPKGFTIVELLIVIVVIGILALLVITTYTGIQQKARNAKRQTDITAIQTQLEAFFQTNGYYPNLTDINNTSFLTSNLKGLDQDALIDPSNYSQSKTLTNSATPSKQYGYIAFQADGTTSCDGASPADQACAKYTIYAMNEGSSPAAYFSKASLN